MATGAESTPRPGMPRASGFTWRGEAGEGAAFTPCFSPQGPGALPPPPTAVCTVCRARLQPRGVNPEHPKGSHPRGKKARAELSGKSQCWPSSRENSEKMRAAALMCEIDRKSVV